MSTVGQKTKVVEWIGGANFAVRVDVEAIIPDFDASEPCLEPAAIRFQNDV